METFSQYNIQVILACVGCFISVIVTVCPKQVTLTRGTKIFLIFVPFLVNALMVATIIAYVYVSDGWDGEGVGTFLDNTDVISFVLNMLAASFVAGIITWIILSILKKTNYTDKQLMRHYIKLTKNQNESGYITIMGGSLDFLGHCPCSKISDSLHNDCEKENQFQYKILRLFGDRGKKKECRNCCLNNGQWKQLTALVDRDCTIRIICARPENNENGQTVRRLLGFILRRWGHHVQIRFYIKGKDPHMRGRIIEDYNRQKHVCWNFKTSNGASNSFMPPYTYSQTERMGGFIIDAIEGIYDSGSPLKEPERGQCTRAFNVYAGKEQNNSAEGRKLNGKQERNRSKTKSNEQGENAKPESSPQP